MIWEPCVYVMLLGWCVDMQEVEIRFNAEISDNDGVREFNCAVEYPASLEQFLPQELLQDNISPEVIIRAFSSGNGSFSTNSLEQAEVTEIQIREKLQSAYEEYIEWEQRLDNWDGTRVYGLLKRKKKSVWSIRGND